MSRCVPENPWIVRCWLLTSPRSGSTYLQYLLNHNAGVPWRPSTTDRTAAKYSFGEHLGEPFSNGWDDFVALDPLVSKIHCHQYGHYLHPLREIKDRYEGIRFVLLERRDSIAQAVSLALANRTGVTQCNSQRQLHQFQSTSIAVDDDELINCYRAVCDYLAFWRDWLHSEPRLVVTYESLIDQPRETVAQILDYLRISHEEISLDVPLQKLQHPQTDGYVLRLRNLIATRPIPLVDPGHDQSGVGDFMCWEEGGGGREKSAPGLARRAVNFGRAVGRHIADGARQVDEATLAARLAVCEDCPSLDVDRRVCREKSCGCFVDRKARWASEDCPLGKWPLPTHQTSSNTTGFDMPLVSAIA